MKTFKQHIGEAKTKKSASVRDIVKELQSKDFGMTQSGGNGDARVVKGNLVVKDTYFFGGDDKLKQMTKEWVGSGFMGKFAAEKWGVKFKLVKSDNAIRDGRIWGKKAGNNGVITLELKVENI